MLLIEDLLPSTSYIMKSFNNLFSVTPLHLDHLKTRSGASPGLWLVMLVPLACSPGLYTTYNHCCPTPRLLALLALQVGMSGIHLYKKLCALRTHHKTGVDDQNQTSLLMLKFLAFHYTPALATAVSISLLTETYLLTAVITTTACTWVLYELTQWLFRTFPGSFSLGEGAVVGQTGALTITCSFHSLFYTIVQQRNFTHLQEISVFIQTAVLILLLLMVGVYKFPLLRASRMFMPYVCSCGVIGMAISSYLLGKWTPIWLLGVIMVTPIRSTLLGWWSGLTLLAVAITIKARRSSSVATTVLRKIFHILIVLVFTPGLLLEPTFTHLAATAAIMFCILLELVRALEIEPIASVISEAFVTFMDEKDGGSLTVSHIYLLAGVASPLWLSPCPLNESQADTVLPLLAGVLAVGIGDTAASVGGTYLGRTRWSGTKKTVEGSVCGVMAQTIAVLFLVGIGTVKMSVAAWSHFLVTILLVAVVEAFTDQVDNIVLPLLLYTSLMHL